MMFNDITQEIEDMEVKVKEYKEEERLLFQKERKLREELKDLERKYFNGKTYDEYVSTLDIEEINEGVEVYVRKYNLQALYKLDGVTLKAYGSVWYNGIINVNAIYPHKTMINVPSKYSREEKHLMDVCMKYIVPNPVAKFKNEYGIHYAY